MQKLVREYLNEWNRKQKKRRKAGIAAALLVVLVVGAVFGTLTQYGIAMTGNAECGLEEHTHTDDCYTDALVCGMAVGEGAHTHNEDCYMTERTLVCVQEESEEHTHTDDCYEERETQICGLEESEGHTHTDACYEKQLTCEKEEHTHTDSCYTAEDAPDATADVESRDIWDAEYANVELPDAWGERLAAVAKMQIGNTESDDNYTVAEDGSQNGYTRYGQFVDDVYRDHWDTAFVNFCMYYAGLTETELFPDEKDGAGQYQEELTDAEIWQEEFKKINKENDGTLACLTEAAGYEPKAGDLVFFEKDTGDGSGAKESRMGIVSSYNKETDELKVTEGDSNDAVEENTYGTDDDQITGYLQTTALEEDSNSADGQDAVQNEETQEDGDGETQEPGGEQGDGEAQEDEGAYVKDLRMIGMTDGSAPFDEDNNPGNDKDSSNDIVRTFDTVQYGFHVEMASKDTSERLQEATVNLKFVLPASKKQAEFDLDAMSWLEGSSLETITNEDGKEQQVLTGKVTLSSERYVVPGSYESTVTIKIKDMKNGDTLNPTIFAAMLNGGTEESGKEIEAGLVTVSAAPKYNVYVDGDVSYRDIFDFTTGKDTAPNRDKGHLPGNVLKVGVALQLYNDNDSKGLKGIQLPEPGSEITFQFKVSSAYQPNDVPTYGSWEESDKNKYMPLLWSFDGSKNFGYDGQDQNERTLEDYSWSSTMVPDNQGDGENACYNGGTWDATQEGDTITVTVSGWEIDPEKMPKKNGEGERDVYAANIGCFSAGEFVFIQPFNQVGSTSQAPNYDIVKKYGEGVFSTSIVTDGKLTVGGEVYDSKESWNKDVIRSNGLTLPGLMTNKVGYLEHGEKWLSPGYTSDRFPLGHFEHGDGYILAGEKLEMLSGITYRPSEDYGPMYWGSNLMKFDGDKLKPTGKIRDIFGNEALNEATLNGKTMVLGENTFVYYAAKPNGENWDDYDEMKKTYEKDLYFYESLDDLEESGKTCVGILTCFKGPGSEKYINSLYQVAHEATVVQNDDYIGTTCVLISTSRAWPQKVFEDEKIDLNSIRLDDTGTDNGITYFKGLPSALRTSDYDQATSDYKRYQEHFRSGNIYGRTWDDEEDKTGEGTGGSLGEWVGSFYTPVKYGVNGNITEGHNSSQMNWGDTLLILGYKSEIAKSLMQTIDETDGNKTKKAEKTRFDLSKDQRVVDYKLEPQINLGKAGTGRISQTTDITIVDTLPNYMEYIPGSAYFGGDYQQVSPEGGQQGIITGGSHGNDSTWTMDVIVNTDTNESQTMTMTITQTIENLTDSGQTLTWKIQDMPLSWVMEPIYYSAKIKNDISKETGDGTTVAIPQKNTAYITSTDDKRERRLENGNYVEKDITAQLSKQTSHGKTVSQKLVEEDGTLDYTIYFNNFDTASDKKTAVVVDTMPKNGLNGSDFNCDYEVGECTLDNDSRGNIRIYYATTEDIDTDIPNTEEEIKAYNWEAHGWIEANIDQNGRVYFGQCKKPVAWAAVKELRFGESIHVNLKIKLKLGEPNTARDKTNKIVNLVKGTASSGSVTVATETVRRALEGLTWLDYNHNGLLDEDEDILSEAVKVELLKLREGAEVDKEASYDPVCYPGTDNPIVIQTGQQVSVRQNSGSITWYGTDTSANEAKPDDTTGIDGHYRFMDLPLGTYALRFSDSEGNEVISRLRATKVNAGDDTKDSDATPVYNSDNNTLARTIIYGIEMPTAEEIEKNGGNAIYHVEHYDSGFYPKTELQILKTGENRDPLAGAIFTIKEGGQAVSFIKNEDGHYTMSDPETDVQPESPEAARFLIALANDERKVMQAGADGSIKIQGKTSDQSQLFEIYDVEGDYKAVKSVETGQWMGYGDIISGESITMQADNEDIPTNPSLHWTFKKWQNGEYHIIPRNDPKQTFRVGIGGNDDKVLLSNGKDGLSQNFLVIPAAKPGETTELEVDSTGNLRIENLSSDTACTIEEFKSPDGYRILNGSVEIRVDKEGMITLWGGQVPEVKVESSTDSGGVLKLTIRNNELYELPSAGGIGIYWYTIGGMLLMFAAALILYKNKCKEVLGG